MGLEQPFEQTNLEEFYSSANYSWHSSEPELSLALHLRREAPEEISRRHFEEVEEWMLRNEVKNWDQFEGECDFTTKREDFNAIQEELKRFYPTVVSTPDFIDFFERKVREGDDNILWKGMLHVNGKTTIKIIHIMLDATTQMWKLHFMSISNEFVFEKFSEEQIIREIG